MDRATRLALIQTCDYLAQHGLHTGTQLVATNGAMDICAAAYRAVTGHIPNCFRTDEQFAELLIVTNEPAMDVIRTISDSLDSEVCETNGQTDYIEHVSNWASTAPIGATTPPTTSEVIGRILRAVQNAEVLANFPRPRAA